MYNVVMLEFPKILSTRKVERSRLLEVEAVDLEFSNGETRTFERVSLPHQSAVMIVPITDNDEFVLIREYAVGLERYELGFPKGAIDGGESMLEAADRELREEAGFTAESYELIKTVAASPSYMKNKLHIVLAKRLSPQKLQGDEPEPLEIVLWPIKDYNRLIERDDFVSSSNLAALLLTKERLHLD
jgi:ADP-ribose diphosphatase